MGTIEKLEKIKGLLSDQDRWTQGYYAKDENGEDVSCFADDACQWCLLGAITKVTDPLLISIDVRNMIDYAIMDLHKDLFEEAKDESVEPVVFFNDHENTTYETVINVIDAAIVHCEA